jgi:UDP-N-acetylmuramoyl-L-alanyl-D-glutamate--2,6-diaminopimelate ligase
MTAVSGTTHPSEVEICGMTADSRAVERGFLFAALPGTKVDGRNFIDQAITRGATAILAPAGTALRSCPRGVALLTAENPRRALALMAARFHGKQPRTIAAITGTSGKTSTAEFTRQLWAALGIPAASLGTLGIITPGRATYGALTTPDPIELHRTLGQLAGEGIDHLAMEASSHGLDQFRLDGVRVGAAAFTNLSRDHLDYHGTVEAYLGAKLRLFEELLAPGSAAVVNADAPEFDEIARRCRARGHRVIAFGRNGAELRLVGQEFTAHGQRLTVELFGKRREALFPVAGGFQAMNALAALGLVIATGSEPEAAFAAISSLKGVHGRLELVARHPNGAPVFVDYAHKPGALEVVLETLRPHAKGALVVVFGCGGDRDRGKRPMMGEIATRLADRVIVTDDNPRSEDPAAIRREILAAAPGAAEIGDRAEAIGAAIRGLGPDDLVVIAGKGHETGQTIAGVAHSFDDSEVARRVAAQLASGRGAA